MSLLAQLRASVRRFRPRRRQPHAISLAAAGLLAQTEAFCAATSLRAQTRAIIGLFSFIWGRPTDRGFTAALVAWVRLLEQHEELRLRFQQSWLSMLARLDSVAFFTDSGLPAQHALLSEATQRLFERLLPSAREDSDTVRLFAAVFSSPGAVERFHLVDGFVFTRLAQILWPAQGLAELPRLHDNMHQALCLLAARLAGRGATPAIRQRSTITEVTESPFYRIIFATEDFVRAESSDVRRTHFKTWQEAIHACRDELSQVQIHMEQAGVSTALMFDITSMEATLDRMELLAATMAEHTEKPSFVARQLLNTLVSGLLQDTRISALIRQNLNLLARKTVERTGHSGEHYIAHTRREYWQMWLAALGGGLLTVFTAALKLRVIESHWPYFIEGFLIGTDYAISFLLLQVFGLALATKQPSMTAATLAGIIRQNRGVSRWSKIADFSAAISRTQLAAALGNVLAVCAGAIVFEQLWQRSFSTHYLAPEAARHVYETLHPFTSGTGIDAAFTGVLLWLAALIGGWCENFAVYNRIPAAIAQHPLGQKIGALRMRRIANWFENNIAAWSTSIVLGYLLGLAPEVARFFGIPLDVRHVTLSTGMLALAAARYGTGAFGHNWFYFAVAGIAMTFVMNLGVSFAIASIVALRAYNVRQSERLSILKYVFNQMAHTPLRFLYPPRAPEAPSVVLTSGELSADSPAADLHSSTREP
jgi:site-specific recombinase